MIRILFVSTSTTVGGAEKTLFTLAILASVLARFYLERCGRPERSAPLNFLQRIADALGLHVAELFGSIAPRMLLTSLRNVLYFH